MHRSKKVIRISKLAGGDRSAFTIVELLVSISIITILVALLLPAIQNARASARRLQCKINLRNIGLAMLNSAEANRRFPAAGYFTPKPDPLTGSDMRHNWVVSLLPWIDQRKIYDEWNFDLSSVDPKNQILANHHLAVLACPSDMTATGNGDLSYVVNGGFGWTGPPGGVITQGHQPVDLNGNGNTTSDPKKDGKPSDHDILKLTGLFFVENWPVGSGTERFHTLNSVTDGLSHTMMLTENIHAGSDSTPNDNWASPLPWRTCFFLSGYVCKDFRCSPGNVDYRRANDRSHPLYRLQAINALDQYEGGAPWPSSYHTGGVNVVFVDGRVQFLSENVDGGVYASLVSPRGAYVEGPLAQRVVSDDEY